MAEEPVTRENENIEELKEALLEEKKKSAAFLADAQRERADYQNLKKRTENDRRIAHFVRFWQPLDPPASLKLDRRPARRALIIACTKF